MSQAPIAPEKIIGKKPGNKHTDAQIARKAALAAAKLERVYAHTRAAMEAERAFLESHRTAAPATAAERAALVRRIGGVTMADNPLSNIVNMDKWRRFKESKPTPSNLLRVVFHFDEHLMIEAFEAIGQAFVDNGRHDVAERIARDAFLVVTDEEVKR